MSANQPELTEYEQWKKQIRSETRNFDQKSEHKSQRQWAKNIGIFLTIVSLFIGAGLLGAVVFNQLVHIESEALVEQVFPAR